jgi:hypothetical protein
MTRFELTPEIVGELRDVFRLRYFVETGIGQLDARAYHLAPLFEHAWAIELDLETCVRARVKAAESVPNLTIYQGSSDSWLRLLCPTLAGPALYWLDAHWTGGGEPPDVECPLLAELEAIGQNYRGDVVLIDDARQFLGTPSPPHNPAKWTTLEQIRAAVTWGSLLVDAGKDLIAIYTEATP